MKNRFRVSLLSMQMFIDPLVKTTGVGVLIFFCHCSDDNRGQSSPVPKVDATTNDVIADSMADVLTDVVDSTKADSPLFEFGPPLIGSVDYSKPIVLDALAAQVPSLFSAATGTASPPCLIEPETDTIYPQNWLRPRFRWLASTPDAIYEISLSVDGKADVLRVYTKQLEWTMTQELWDGLRTQLTDRPFVVSVRSAKLNGTTLSEISTSQSASARVLWQSVPGSIVYWTTTGSLLRGFTLGQEKSPVQVLATTNVKQRSDYKCIGCHSGAPDGQWIGLGAQVGNNSFQTALASNDNNTFGQTPSWLSTAAKNTLESRAYAMLAFSQNYWAPTKRWLVVGNASDNKPDSLAWIDLEATDIAQAKGVIKRDGDPGIALMPSWSQDGQTIVYGSVSAQVDGRFDVAGSDLYRVPFNNRAGGTAIKIEGASSSSFSEYYPEISPDGQLVTYTRIPDGQSNYNNHNAEILVIPTQGGTGTRIKANDPPQCTGQKSPGLLNSWSRFAPTAEKVKDGTLYWMVFSSIRFFNRPQLFFSPVLVKADGQMQTFGALYPWNQPSNEANHTPIWGKLEVPSVPR